MCKKQRKNNDDSSSNGNEGEPSDSSTPSNEIHDGEMKSLVAFLQMKSLCPERGMRPQQTSMDAFVGKKQRKYSLQI